MNREPLQISLERVRSRLQGREKGCLKVFEELATYILTRTGFFCPRWYLKTCQHISKRSRSTYPLKLISQYREWCRPINARRILRTSITRRIQESQNHSAESMLHAGRIPPINSVFVVRAEPFLHEVFWRIPIYRTTPPPYRIAWGSYGYVRKYFCHYLPRSFL